jgi:hypothetical protein
MSFVLLAVLGAAIAVSAVLMISVSAVLMIYVLARRWL